ncbi:TonB-dependent receptor domain-containing protein [Cellulophaga tyrosinoxydans]|uniref:CarboxypepD_reg-like domain-containing protein n=1 Tax=Cellulophaga tyrosinoxydans TaxID=504486 RepID=A0A1W1YUC9_9FLAO|nr:outer membrane beta-barrel family protein [Cellulophaga tyrosinoxydans]SMC39712.1 CarboxypepD_reg-like domain-containing protein [Cellulophaga tyrosinoxydans]
MLKTALTFFFLIFVAIQIGSAQEYEVSGTVKSSTNEIIPFANVFLLNSTDSTLIKGSSANEDGTFTLKNIKAETYYLQASYVGKLSSYTSIAVSKDVNIGSIIIEEEVDQLDEVVVVSKKPTIERKPDRLVFNVENTSISQGNSWDILKRTPGVIVAQDELQIKNQEATIYINNRKVQLSADEVKNLLEGLSGGNIKSIEVIANPPAEFEAEGGPVLNIITSKNIVPGYKGSINGNYTQAFYPKYAFGTSHYYKTDKLNLFANYTINPRKEIKKDDSNAKYVDNTNAIYSIWDTKFQRITRSQAQNATLILDYDFDVKNSLNLTSNLSYSPNKTYSNTLESLIQNSQQQLDSTLNTNSNLENNNTNLAVDLSYKHKFDRDGSFISFNGHYTNFNEDQYQGVYSNYFFPNGNLIRSFNFSTDAKQDIQIYTGQVDLVMPLDKVRYETGAKASLINSTSGINYFTIVGANQTLNTSLSDNYEYDETILAGYASASRDWDKWSLKIGLRGEYTDAVGTSISLNSNNTQNYFELFPSVFALHSPTENHSFSFDYSRKLERPRYDDLNPFSYFLNENSFSTGNPNLRPSFSHNFNINYTLKDTYFFDFYYKDRGKEIGLLTFQDNQAQTTQQISTNLLKAISYGFDFNYGNSITKNWFLASYISIFSEEETFLVEQSNNQIYTNDVKGIYVYLGNYITLSKDGTFSGDMGVTYLSGFLRGNYKMSESTNLTMGLRKTLWNKKGVVTLAAEDVLGLANATFTSKYFNQDYSYYAQPESQFVRVGFTYNFGNFKLSDNKRDIEKVERDRLKKD